MQQEQREAAEAEALDLRSRLAQRTDELPLAREEVPPIQEALDTANSELARRKAALQAAREDTAAARATHAVHTRCARGGQAGKRACLLARLPSEHSPRCCTAQLTCEQHAWYGLCAKAGGHASSSLHTGSQAGSQAPEAGLWAHF